MTNRRSYRGLLALPAWRMYKNGQCVVSVRAATLREARAIFNAHGYVGGRVKKGSCG